MAGPFDWARYITGDRDNPEEDIGQWSDENQKRNRAALGLDANGNPLPAAAAPAAPGAPTPGAPTALPGANPAADGSAPPDPSQQAAAQAQASSTLPPNQEPNATKTPVSLGHMMMNLQQYNEREQGFNQALGMGFAAFAQPRDRDMVSKMFNTTPADPMKIAQTQMSLGQQQQGQDRANAITTIANDPIRGPALASQLHMDWGALKAGLLTDPGMAGKIAQALGTPTDKMRDLTQLGNMGGGQGGPGGPNGSAIGDIKSGIVSGIAGPESAPMLSAQQAWRAANPGKPDSAMPWHPNDLQSFTQYKADQQELSTSVAKASSAHADAVPTLISMQQRIEDVKNNPALDTLMSNQAKKDQAQYLLNSDPNTPWAILIKTLPAGKPVLNTQEMQLVSQIRQLNGQEYAEALNTLHQTRPAASEITAMKTGIGQTQSISEMDADAYRKQALDPLSEGVKTTIGNSYGASQQLKNMPAEYRTFVSPQFLAGGSRALENNGSESWAAGTQITPEEVQTAKNWQKPVSQGGNGLTHAQAVAKVREMGIRPDGV